MKSPAPWKLWANPIIRRYARARLRPHALGVALILTLMVAGFIFFSTRTVSMYRGGMAVVDAERIPLLPLMALQALILFFLAPAKSQAASLPRRMRACSNTNG